MKKLISLLLAMTMVLSLVTVGFATAEISEGGWRGAAVITAENPGSGDRGGVVKVNGTATLTPNVNAIANTPIIEMTADIYGTGTIALVNGVGTAAVTVTVTAATAGYKANDWNEVKLLAVTGLKTYKAYVNGTEVASGTVEKTTTPVKISFTGENLYVDNIVLKEYRKNGAYDESVLSNSYTPTKMYNTNRTQPEMDGADGKWAVYVWNYADSGRSEEWHTSSTIKHLPDSTTFASDPTKKHVVKMTKMNSGTTANNPLMYNGAASGNSVYSFDLYVEDEDVTDTEAGTKAPELVFQFFDENSKAFTAASLYEGNLILPNGYNKANAYNVGNNDWHNIRIELNKETQSIDIFWDNEKVNPYPITAGNNGVDGFNSITKMQFYINYTLGKATYYMANFRVDELTLPGGTVAETVFEESFDASASKLVYNANGNADSYLSLQSGVSKEGRTAGKMEFAAHADPSGYMVKEGTSTSSATEEDKIESTVISARSANEYFAANLNDISQKNVLDIKVTYDFYDAAVARASSGSVRDALYVEFVDSDADTPVLMGHYLQGSGIYGHSTGSYTVSNLYRDGKKKTQEWQSAIDHRADINHPELVYSTGLEGNTRVDAGGSAYRTVAGITSDVLKKVDQVRLYVLCNNGGLYYLDNFKVVATIDYGTPDVIGSCYTAETFYSNAIDVEETPAGLSVADIATNNGKVASVTLSNNGAEIGDNAKMFVAVYNGDALLDCGVTAIADSDFADGDKTFSFTDVDYARDAVIRVFILDKDTLVPVYTMDAPKTVFILGDSLVQDYIGLPYDNDQSGWGEVEKIGAYLNLGKAAVKDYAIGGTSSKDFFSRLQETVDGERFNIPNRDFWAQVKEGDYIFICTATNDSKIEQAARYADPYGSADEEGSYLNNLVEMYIKPAEERGAIPVLVTTGAILGSKNTDNGRYICADGGYMRPVEPYIQNLRAFAEEEGYAIVDLWALWTDMLSAISTETAKAEYYVATDNTHTNTKGAAKAAEFIAICLEQLDGIKDLVK